MAKLRKTIVALGIASSLTGTAKETPLSADDNIPDKYKTSVTITNDSVSIVGATSAFYNQSNDSIYLYAGDMKWSDFGYENAPKEKDRNVVIVHERQHQINARKGVGKSNMSLIENYQRDVHNEITALIAEKIEIRRQYKACKNESERQAFFQKFDSDKDNAEYINAIKSGKINPNSPNEQDFLNEMAFIKNSSINYRADPTDDGYKEHWTEHALIFLAERGENVKPNPEALKKEVEAMYHIGGFDFNTVGNKNIYVIDNQSISAADKMLQQGADPQKLARFMRLGEGAFRLAESLDVSGLNREQAETVLQTAFMTQDLTSDISESIALGQDPEFDFNYVTRSSRNKVAVYLDVKSDIWEKNGTLTEQGDKEKFNRLMKQAKQVKLDPQSWYKQNWYRLTMAQDPKRADEFEALKKRVKELQGTIVDFDVAVHNMDEYKLPLDNISKEEVLQEMAQKEAEDKAFAEEYLKEHPEKRRLSAPYQIQIMDLESNILKDEQEQIKEQSKHVEPLYPNAPQIKTPYQDGKKFEIPSAQYRKAEIKTTVNTENGASTEVALIDGQKHGAEILRDKEGNILGYKLYDHGQELNKENYEFNLVSEAGPNGETHTYTELNGQKFGLEIVSDQQGNTWAAFFEQNGSLITGKSLATIEKNTETTNPRQQLKEELQAQTGELPENPQAEAQNLRIDIRLSKREKEKQVPAQNKKTTNSQVPPVLQNQTERE